MTEPAAKKPGKESGDIVCKHIDAAMAELEAGGYVVDAIVSFTAFDGWDFHIGCVATERPMPTGAEPEQIGALAVRYAAEELLRSGNPAPRSELRHKLDEAVREHLRSPPCSAPDADPQSIGLTFGAAQLRCSHMMVGSVLHWMKTRNVDAIVCFLRAMASVYPDDLGQVVADGMIDQMAVGARAAGWKPHEKAEGVDRWFGDVLDAVRARLKAEASAS